MFSAIHITQKGKKFQEVHGAGRWQLFTVPRNAAGSDGGFTLAACYGYVTTPWIDFDRPPFEINFHHITEVRDLLLGAADRPMSNVMKSHHPVDFFTGALDKTTERYVLFVICRHPAAVMLSFWRFLHQWS
jgi:hypothetical protein